MRHDHDVRTFTYANSAQPPLKRLAIRAVEATARRRRHARIYHLWRSEIVPSGEHLFTRLLGLVRIRLAIAGAWPPALPQTPLVLVANHPFGIGDGMAMLSLAERLDRPFRVLLHADLLKVPEIRPFALAVDFSETREALARNIAVRHEAVRLLREGTTIVIFPGGGVATAPKGFGKAEDLPWKVFVAKLIQEAESSVLPVHFQGQNSLLFHLVSRPMNLADSSNRIARLVGNASLTLRLSLLIREFTRLSGRTITVTVGPVITWQRMSGMRERRQLLAFLRDTVMALAPPADAKGEALLALISRKWRRRPTN